MMEALSLEGGFSDVPVQASLAFRAAMNAMARPGTIHAVAGGEGPAPLSVAASTLMLTLCDPETPVHLAGAHDTAAVRGWITFHTGAPLVGPEDAMFALGTWGALPLSRFPVGTAEYPDRSATLIVEMAELVAEGAELRGPGIRDRAALNLPEREAFRTNAARYPLGPDFYFTCGKALAALPRSTKVS